MLKSKLTKIEILFLSLFAFLLVFGGIRLWSSWNASRAAHEARLAAVARECIDHLTAVDSAKRQWAKEWQKDTNSIPTWDDLEIYLMNVVVSLGGKQPRCPIGGDYVIGRVADPVTCTVPKHEMALGTVRFAVIDEARVPLPEARVEVFDESGKKTIGLTDGNGRAAIDIWPQRAVSFVVVKEGYVTSSNTRPPYDFIKLTKIGALTNTP